MEVCDLETVRPRPSDSALVVGGGRQAMDTAVASRPLVAWVARAAPIVRRIGSVCTGALVLAQAGVLDGKRAATHWSVCRRLARLWPRVEVDRDAIFVRDGHVWTSAGVSTGIDMALAMVEEDHGVELADALAAHLVLPGRRPGFQSQFSDVLIAQRDATQPLGAVLAWARANLRGPVDAGGLARRAGMSQRTFHRRCLEQFRRTPAKLIEDLRIEHARTLLATTALGTKAIATRAGFGTPERMARVFKRALGIAPSDYARATEPGRPRAARAPHSGPT
jgi:transcriptional regulator GlxA family with amidase domain